MLFEFNRREVLAGIGAAVCTPGSRGESSIGAPWPSVPAGAAGFVDDLEVRFDKLLADKRVWGLHGVLAVRGKRIVLERYFAGDENNWGKVTRNVSYSPETLHNLYSVTKGVVALIYGTALAQGKAPPPEAPLYAQFPEHADLLTADDPRKALTIAHALTMTLGLNWEEIGLPYDSLRNDEIGIEHSKDRYRFILDRPLVYPPGKRWLYCGGATALLGRLIAKGTGKPLPDFAREALFDPVGIGPTEWINNKDTWVAAQFGIGDGEPVAASGLRMTPRDLARIGQLVIDGGAANGRQVIPVRWIEQCMTPRISSSERERYGYQWYIGDLEFRSHSGPRLEHFVAGFGNGGQRLFVFPDLELVVVVTGGNFSPEQWMPPMRVLREVVLSSIR